MVAQEQPSNVLYLGHLPFGFFEDQIWAFFSQFGNVSKVRVVRNPRTGKSRHYGFIEFELSEVARIAADAMDKYLMYGKSLVAKVVPADKTGSVRWGKSTLTSAPPNLYTAKNGAIKLMPRDRSQVAGTHMLKSRRGKVDKAKRVVDMLKHKAALQRRQTNMMNRLAEAGLAYALE